MCVYRIEKETARQLWTLEEGPICIGLSEATWLRSAYVDVGGAKVNRCKEKKKGEQARPGTGKGLVLNLHFSNER